MKTLKIFWVIYLLIISKLTFAHKEWVHQYIVQQGYYFLESEYANSCGDINDLAKI